MGNETILVVDDEPANLSVLSKILMNDYSVRVANSGVRALQVATTKPRPDLILLDIMMPEIDGYSVLKQLKESELTQSIPVIFVTAMVEMADEEKGLELGAVDYISKPIRPAILLARVKAQLLLKRARDFLHEKNDFLESEINRRMAENQIIQNVSIRALAHLAETRDPETGEHILRTQAYVNILTEYLALHPRFKSTITPNFIELIGKSAPLHDIGKVGIPDQILQKPGKLTSDEWEVMKTHAEIGAKAIEQAESDVRQPIEFLSIAKEIAHWHHEKWDGSGYPDGLTGDEIPLSARLMAIADVFDALISVRVYKPGMTPDKTRDIIISERGRHFDPDITDAFIACYDQFLCVANKYKS
jgi:putative two-component system response regulator